MNQEPQYYVQPRCYIFGLDILLRFVNLSLCNWQHIEGFYTYTKVLRLGCALCHCLIPFMLVSDIRLQVGSDAIN